LLMASPRTAGYPSAIYLQETKQQIGLAAQNSTYLQTPATNKSRLVCVSNKHNIFRHRTTSLYYMNCRASISPAAPVTDEKPMTGDSFIRPHSRELAAYQPILPFEVLSAWLGRKPQDIIKLDANENPYGPPPEVMEALGNMEFPYIYPDPESRRLRATLAEDSGLDASYLLAGCGADELIDLIMRCVLDPGDKIIDCPPTFTMYEFDAGVNGATVIKVPRLSYFSLDVFWYY
jgi:hypothetical protein